MFSMYPLVCEGARVVVETSRVVVVLKPGPPKSESPDSVAAEAGAAGEAEPANENDDCDMAPGEGGLNRNQRSRGTLGYG